MTTSGSPGEGKQIFMGIFWRGRFYETLQIGWIPWSNSKWFQWL